MNSQGWTYSGKPLTLVLYLVLLSEIGSRHCSNAFSFENINRRTVIGSLISSSSALIVPNNAYGLPQQGIQGSGGSITRVEGLGGGFDLTISATSKGVDVIYPSSMEGRWNCRRVVTSVEGDAGQAELAWRNLGGCGRSMVNNIESFDTKFIVPSPELNVKNEYTFDGETFKGVILDRGSELESRAQGQYNVKWNFDLPDILTFENEKDKASDVEVVVVQRKVEMPSEKGFGFDELYRITSSAGGIFGGNKVQRAVRVKRKYRRGLDENGNRIVEGLEIAKTYRVLDGIAGVEMPTSTTKSQIKLRRV